MRQLELKLLILLCFFCFLASASEPGAFERLQTQGQTLRSELQSLILPIKNPGTVGVEKLSKAEISQRLTQLQSQFLTWKEEAENYLKTESSEIDQAAKVILFYFTQLSIYVQMNVFFGRSEVLTEDFQKPFYFEVTQDLLLEMSGRSLLELSTMQRSPIELVEDTSSRGEAPVILSEAPVILSEAKDLHLRLSRLHLNSMEQNQLTQNPSNENYFSLVQYILVLWLVEQYQEVGALLNLKNLEINVPSEMTQRLKAYSNLNDILKKKETYTEETRFRQALLSTSDILKDKKFANEAFILEFSKLFAPEAKLEEAVSSFRSQFEAGEKEFLTVLKIVLDAQPLVLKNLIEAKDHAAFVSLLREVFTQARAGHVSSQLPGPEQLPIMLAQGLASLLIQRTEALFTEISDEDIQNWIQAAQEKQKTMQTLSDAYVQDVVQVSQEFQKTSVLSDEELEVDLVTLDLTLQEDFMMMQVSDITQQRKMKFLSQDSYEKAKTVYEDIKRGMVGYAEIHGVETEPDLRDAIYDESLKMRRKEREDWDKIGKYFFPTSSTTPHLSELDLSDVQKERYRKMMKLKAFNAYPPLLIETLEDSDETPLFEKLAALHLENEQEAKSANAWIENNLFLVKSKIEKNLDLLFNAKNLEEIRLVVAKSPLLNILMSQFPAYKKQTEDLRELVNFPSFSQLTWEETFHAATSKGFLFILAHMVLKWIPPVRNNPYFRAADEAVTPYIGPFLLVGFSMVGVNAFWQYKTLSQKDEDNETLLDFYLTAPKGDTILDAFIIDREQSMTEAGWLQWKMERYMEAGFLSFMLFARPAMRVFSGIRNKYLESLMTKVGFPKNVYSFKEADIMATAQASRNSIQAQKPPKLVEEMLLKDVTQAENKLLKILQKKEKSFSKLTKTYAEDFEALRVEPGTWDPMELVQAVKRMEKLHQEKLISLRDFEKAKESYRKLMFYMMGQFSMVHPDSAMGALNRRIIFGRTRVSTDGVKVVEDVGAQFFREYSEVLQRTASDVEVTTEMVSLSDGSPVEIIRFKRVNPYLAPSFTWQSMLKWPRWVLESLEESAQAEAKIYQNIYRYLRVKHARAKAAKGGGE